MLQRRGEEEGRTRLSLTEGSDLFCFAAGWRPPTRRSAGPMLSLRSRTSFFLPSTPLSLSLNPGEMKDAVRQIELMEEEGWRKGAGWEMGQLVGPVRARALSDERKRRDSSVIMHMVLFSPYRSRRIRRGTIAWPKSRNSKRSVPFTRHNLPNGAGPRTFLTIVVRPMRFSRYVGCCCHRWKRNGKCMRARGKWARACKSRLMYQHANLLIFYTFSHYAPREVASNVTRKHPFWLIFDCPFATFSCF